MKLLEVNNPTREKWFLKVNVLMNQNDPAYIQPLDHEVMDVFNPTTNKNFEHGKTIRWILTDDNENLIGRIAAFVNDKYKNKGTEFATGGIGYFDCINNQEAANILFNAAKEFLIQNNVEAMDGPINFGDRDKNWGIMVEGFGKEPAYGMSYNPPYYQQLFENYGFQNYYYQYFYTMQVDDPLAPRFAERHARFKAKPEYSVKHLNKNEIEKYAHAFSVVYNAAWAQHGEEKEISPQQAILLFQKMKPIIDERMVWFAFYKDEPIGMFINIPDLNQYFKHFHGKFGIWQKLHLLLMTKTGTAKKLTGLAFGVVPKYQALGIDSYMIQECALLVQGKGWYHQYEMGWAGDWNPKMINIYKSLGGIQSRIMVTYRYIFNNKYPFQRHPTMEYK